jgi:hypothetical protein
VGLRFVALSEVDLEQRSRRKQQGRTAATSVMRVTYVALLCRFLW